MNQIRDIVVTRYEQSVVLRTSHLRTAVFEARLIKQEVLPPIGLCVLFCSGDEGFMFGIQSREGYLDLSVSGVYHAQQPMYWYHYIASVN